MRAIIGWLETVFTSIPLPMLEVWGRLGYMLGFALMLCAYGGLTFRPGGRWGFGRQRQTWNTRALLAMVLTFTLIFVSGYLGSFIVLVPGAQTFESLKDLCVFLCIVLFGYPALLIVPFAYGLSDLVEGVPPSFLADWAFGYFINPACFWIAWQLFGRDPDFRRAGTWLRYALFVVLFMAIEPLLWGHITATQFTPRLSYGSVTPALFFTTSITWLLAPFAMMAALPLARRFKMLWSEIPQHVSERAFGQKEWIYVDGQAAETSHAIPIRLFLGAPFIALVLVLVAVTAYVNLRSAEDTAGKLATRLHEEIADNINLRLDDFLDAQEKNHVPLRMESLKELLDALPLARSGRALILSRDGRILAASRPSADAEDVAPTALQALRRNVGTVGALHGVMQFRFDHVTARPLGRETWLAQATPYEDRAGKVDWVLLTAMPEAYYLEGVRTGSSRSAVVFALAIAFSLLAAIAVAAVVTAPIRRVARATQAVAEGDHGQRVPKSRLAELDALSDAFNDMAGLLAAREKSLEESERRYRTMFEDIPIALFRVTRDGAYKELNQAGMDLIGLKDRARLNELHVTDLYADSAESAAWHAVVESATDEHPRRAELKLKRLDNGQPILASIVSRTVRDKATGEISHYEGSVEDITERKRAEEELLRHRDHLEELVRDRTAALEAALLRAESASEAKSAFLSNMSHELRTPLNSVIGFSRLLSQSSAMRADERHKLGMINRSGHHLLTLINDILDLSKIESGRMELQLAPLDLRSTADAALEMVQLRADQQAIHLAHHYSALPDAVYADAPKLRQVLLNLLSNAVKFAPGGHVTLDIHARAIGGARVAVDFAVHDDGPGIAEADHERIFEPFVQTAGTQGGTGLGLPISREFVRMMGGELALRSSPGAGSTFSFTLELERDEAIVTATPAPMHVVGLAPGEVGRTILVVDDNPDGCELLRDLLGPLGFHVHEAHDGAHAVDRISALQPHLVFMDWRMPRMDGLEATRRVRAMSGMPQPKIVILSASAFEEERTQALASGADAFLRKPLEQETLFAVLAQQLGLHFKVEDDEDLATAIATRSPLTQEDVAALPYGLVAELKRAVQEMHTMRIGALLLDIAEEHPGTGARIRAMIERAQYQQLWTMLHQRTGAA